MSTEERYWQWEKRVEDGMSTDGADTILGPNALRELPGTAKSSEDVRLILERLASKWEREREDAEALRERTRMLERYLAESGHWSA